MPKWTEGILLLLLAVTAVEDYRFQKLKLRVLFLGGAAGTGLRLLTGQWDAWDILTGTLVGAGMLLIGYASRQALGYGDGLLLFVSGIFIGGMRNLILLLCSLTAAAITSMLLLVLKRISRKDRIPFAPFVLGGFVLMEALYW